MVLISASATPSRVELNKLLREAAKHVMTPQEIWDQRVSFVYGQCMDSSSVTKEQVIEQATRVYGPRPEDDAEPTVRALASCQVDDCSMECSFYLGMLRMLNGQPICQTCLEEGDFQEYDEENDKFVPDWHDLPPVTIEMLKE